jgi:S-adenosyl-L-methionine hydrolase (adenosine-forming)
MSRRITLLTDFGTVDGYVGAVKGVIAARAPGVLVDDVSHGIDRADVRGASRALRRYWSLYPEGTVHMVVVDPGVGTTRRALACEADGRFLVAPDNGLLTPVLTDASAWWAVRIEDTPGPPPAASGRSSTFHGRDIFAPAAAHLALGRSLGALGPRVTDPIRLHEPEPVAQVGAGNGVVVGVDHFGNLLTNLPGAWLVEGGVVSIAGRQLRTVSTYGDARLGELVALVSSDGRVEVAARDGSAAEELGVGSGAAVSVRRARPG